VSEDAEILLVENADGSAVEALDALRGAGVAVRSFELVKPTLEDLFLETVAGENGRA
jgi:ABC-type uncharacterized transport system ATPase subunit